MIKKLLFIFALCMAGVSAEESVEHTLYKTIGTVYPQYRSVIGSQVAGCVQEVLVEVGDSVQKGSVLLRLDPALFSIAVAEAQALFSSALIECNDANRDFERMKKLFEKPEGETPSISQKRYEDAASRAEHAKISCVKAEEFLKKIQRNKEDAEIKAPFDGVVTKRFISPGESVSVTPGTKLIEILSLDNAYAEFSVPQQYLGCIDVGSQIFLKVEGISVDEISVTITRIFPDIEEKTRAFKCRATLPKNFGKYSGALLQVMVPLQAEKSV